jgi:para-nitrobenzyl esterase
LFYYNFNFKYLYAKSKCCKQEDVMKNDKPIVNTLSGKIEGYQKDGLFIFKGIPYAAPPVGELRWCPPQPVIPWNGVRPAIEFSAIAHQNEMPGALPGMAIAGAKNENCLFLNIWTPGIDDAKRPVMLWIHGGAFILGAGSEVMYNGRRIAQRGNVVFVSINYRLGALGFLNLNEITGGKISSTGCEALLDQIAAIDWVYDNIQAFGGDPDNITVFGESAGAMSIGTLMGMPKAKGKIRKVILESGAANTVCPLDEAKEISSEFLTVLGLKGSDADKLRLLKAGQLMSAQQKLAEIMMMKDGRLTPFCPVVDGKVLPNIPIMTIRKGAASDIKIIAGSNLEEFKFFDLMNPGFKYLTEANIISSLQIILDGLVPEDRIPDIMAAYKKARESRGESSASGDIFTAIKTDLMFRMSCLNLADAQTKNNQLIYNYLFTWKSPVMGEMLGSCHALEVGFVFGTHDDTFCGTGPDADALSEKMQNAWFAFARTGDPSCDSLGRWEPYGNSRRTMILGKECRLVDAPYDDERRIWDQMNITFTKPI